MIIWINFVDTQHIVEINKLLMNGHRRRIRLTPFKWWCLELKRSLDIYSPLLIELFRRWDESEQSFHIWKHLVPLFMVDVCFSLGLGVVGEEVEFDVYGCELIDSLFCGERIIIKGITNMIRSIIGTDWDDVDNVPRLYILLGFAVLFFPRNSKVVYNMPFRILDDIDSLVNFNWGTAVHNFFVNGLSRAYVVHNQNKNDYNITLGGSVVVL